MIITHFGGTVECKTIEALDSVLHMRYGSGVNEFWISDGGETPCLAILVNNDYANLTYFPDEGHPGFQSVGMGTTLDLQAVTVFYTNTPNEEMEVSNDAVVPFAAALEAAKEYFVSHEIPACLIWVEM